VSSTALVAIQPVGDAPVPVDLRLLRLKQMVVDAATAANSKRNYAKALDHLFAFAVGRPVTRELLFEWRASMEKLSPSTVNIRLSAMRSLVAVERRRDGLSSEEAAKLAETRPFTSIASWIIFGCTATSSSKTGRFKPEWAGKLNFYLSAVDDLYRNGPDASTLGQFLGESNNSALAEYALRDVAKPTGVSTYSSDQGVARGDPGRTTRGRRSAGSCGKTPLRDGTTEAGSG
jgi:hypothetical protein